jgi:LysR family glycine cleavage system transcriptional activator
VHRLGRFVEAHPDIDLRVAASHRHVDFAREDIDMAIRHGDGQWPGMSVTRLCVEEIYPVCSPELVRGRGALRSATDLARHTLLHVNDRRDWGNWLDAAGMAATGSDRGPIFNQASMAIDAAVDGQGIALARSALAAWDMRAGRLVRPLPFALKAPYGYWIVCPKSTADLPKIAGFRDWLLAEAADDVRQVDKMKSKAKASR